MSALRIERRLILAVFACSIFAVSTSMSLSKYSIKQSINLPGVKKAMQAVFQPTLVVPQISVRGISDIDFKGMKSNGISCVVFDKDNTLSHTYVDELHPSVVAKVDECRDLFPGAIAILSNSVGSCDDHEYEAAANTERLMSLPVIRHKVKKPACLKEVLDHFELVLKRPVAPTEICMIGDRVLTDVVFANQNDMVSVLVAPLSLVKDHPIAVLIRWVETKILLPLLRVFGVKARPMYTAGAPGGVKGASGVKSGLAGVVKASASNPMDDKNK